MPTLYDISNWSQLRSFHTGGTRNKKYLQSPDHQNYFFKESQKKEVKDYKVEFWSEIIAHELGAMFGINVLRYDVAILNDKIGCLSKSMIDPGKEEMVELGKYLQTFNPAFEYQERKPGKTYTFQLISEAIESLGLNRFLPNIIETIVFDSVIGNGDRHQENLAIIIPFGLRSEIAEGTKKIIEEPRGFMSRFLKALSKEDKEEARLLLDKWKLKTNDNAKYAPIYDSGSSLGRELSEQALEECLNDNEKFARFVKNGKSEIHWEGQKLKHLELVRNLTKLYPYEVSATIKQIVGGYDPQKFKSTLEQMDADVPDTFAAYRLSSQRKIFIERLVTERIRLLSEVIR